jgi:hypothetical protein
MKTHALTFRPPLTVRFVALITTGLLLAAGTWAPTVVAGPPPKRLQTVTEQLYMNVRQLDHIYKDVREFAQKSVLRGSDRQLDYIQKASLYINDARRLAHHQWQLFSIMNYIRTDARTDYYTLRLNDLPGVVSDTRFAVKLLELYSASIENEFVKTAIGNALGIIEANLYMFAQMEAILRPLSHPPRQPRIN